GTSGVSPVQKLLLTNVYPTTRGPHSATLTHPPGSTEVKAVSHTFAEPPLFANAGTVTVIAPAVSAHTVRIREACTFPPMKRCVRTMFDASVAASCRLPDALRRGDPSSS